MSKKILSSLQNPLVKHWVKLRQNADYRHEHKRVLIEGSKMVHEIALHHPVYSIIALNESLLPKDTRAEEIYIVPEEILYKISGSLHPEGIIAEVAMPTPGTLKPNQKILVLDSISDPGNMGALIRTTLALSWDAICLVGSCCDPFNDKALRAAKGATFRLPLIHSNWKELKEFASTHKKEFIVADLKGKEPTEFAGKNNFLLVLSNESHGVSEEAASYPKVSIPITGNMESLNVAVAGGILLFTLGGSHAAQR